MQVLELPEWLGAALAGALLATLGYVCKLLLEWIEAFYERRRIRHARLVALYSLLRAGRAAFDIQADLRNKLQDLIEHREPEMASKLIEKGYEHLFAETYQTMTPDEKELHGIIRTITENTLRPINKLLLKWVREDDYYKARMRGRGPKTELANYLSQLEAHLLLWHAKYKVWMPNQPSHALVYMADEQAHGVGFPTELQGVTEKILRKR